MKRFIYGSPMENNTYLYGGYVDRIDSEKIVALYDYNDNYFAIVSFGSHCEKYQIGEKDYKELLSEER